jgi:hypothetical protein
MDLPYVVAMTFQVGQDKLKLVNASGVRHVCNCLDAPI